MSYKSIRAFARDLDKQIQKEAVRVVRTSISRGLSEGHKQSQGTATYLEIARADHPFATRHGGPLWDLLPIHKHTGQFDAGWFSSLPSAMTDRPSGRVANFSPVAQYLKDGTPVMFSRGIQEHLTQFVENTAYQETRFSIKSIARRFNS